MQAKSECDWVMMSSVFVASQSSCFSSLFAPSMVRANKFAYSGKQALGRL
jgi:hypothetical protein